MCEQLKKNPLKIRGGGVDKHSITPSKIQGGIATPPTDDVVWGPCLAPLNVPMVSLLVKLNTDIDEPNLLVS